MEDQSLLYRFKSMIHAIEFFSGRFEIEQLIDYAYDFVNELIVVDRLAIFAKVGDDYRVIKMENYANASYSFPVEPQYEDSVMLHAGLFHEDDIKRILPETLSEEFPASLGIPLVMDKKMYGIVIMDRDEGKVSFDDQDQIIATALMNLFYNALTNYDSFYALEAVRKRLDEKVFSLFAINQSSKVLLGTHDINTIAQLSISVFSELTQSTSTALYLYDSISEKFKLNAYNHVLSMDRTPIEKFAFQTSESNDLAKKTYYDLTVKEDYDTFCTAFGNGQPLIDDLESVLIVPLCKEGQCVGFVSLSKRVNDRVYGTGLLELIESLAAYLYISIANANQLITIEEQKLKMNQQLQMLDQLNRMVKNINSSTTIDQLLEVAMSTMALTYDVKCGFVGKVEDKRITIIKHNNCDELDESILIGQKTAKLFFGESILASTIQEAEDILGKTYLSGIEGRYSGCLMVPIYIMEEDVKLLGVMTLFDIGDSVITDETNQLVFETIAGSIAPIWYQLEQAAKIKASYKPDVQYLLKEAFEKTIEESQMFSQTFEAFMIIDNDAPPFHTNEKFVTIGEGYRYTFELDSKHCIIIGFDFDDEDTLSARCEMYNLEFKKATYTDDFEDYNGFIKFIS